jgi:hypothetical protein
MRTPLRAVERHCRCAHWRHWKRYIRATIVLKQFYMRAVQGLRVGVPPGSIQLRVRRKPGAFRYEQVHQVMRIPIMYCIHPRDGAIEVPRASDSWA